MKTAFRSSATLLFCLMALGITSCKKDSGSVASASKPLISLSVSATVGDTILVDSSGRAVYNFIFDQKGYAVCNTGCAVVWPHVYFAGLKQSDLGKGLNIADFSVTTNMDGTQQTTFKGHPMYIYSNDSKENGAWTVTGNNIEGGVWFAVQPHFSVFFLSPKFITTDTVTYLTSANGMALYTTSQSTMGTEWSAYRPTVGTIKVPARLSVADFSINMDGGLVYKGQVLYLNANDKTIGDTNGSGETGWSLIPIN